MYFLQLIDVVLSVMTELYGDDDVECWLIAQDQPI